VAQDARIGGRMLACLGELGIRVDLVSHGPGDVGLSCALAEAELQPAMEALHATFFPGGAQVSTQAPASAPASKVVSKAASAAKPSKARAPQPRGRTQETRP
jgi:hypothetical protein